MLDGTVCTVGIGYWLVLEILIILRILWVLWVLDRTACTAGIGYWLVLGDTDNTTGTGGTLGNGY